MEHLRQRHAQRPHVHLAVVRLAFSGPRRRYAVADEQLRSAVVARDDVVRQLCRVAAGETKVADLRVRRGEKQNGNVC